jgi:putative membrane protein
LLRYYVLMSLLAGPAFFVPLLPLYFKYVTLRYHFDEKGISMSWGILWRREVLLTYRRIQDIHLTRNIVQRWLGLATVSIQTASGSASAEMSIEGILEAEALRDFLYAKMRGARGLTDEAAGDKGAASPADEALTLLRDIRDSLAALAARGASP